MRRTYRFCRKASSIFLVGLLVFAGLIPTNTRLLRAETTEGATSESEQEVPDALPVFDQGAGYQQGLYDQSAEQPTVFNWTRQSRFKGPEKGEILWTFDNHGSYERLNPVVDAEGTIYVGGDKLYAVKPDGVEKWSLALSNRVTSNPVVGQEGTIYVGSDKFYAIDKSGVIKWQSEVQVVSGTSPALNSEGIIYLSSTDNDLHAMDSEGNELWKFKTEGYLNSSPAVALDGTVYVGSADMNLYALNPDGTLKWKYLTKGRISTSPVIGPDGAIYVGSEDKTFYAVNPDGTSRWDFPTGGAIRTSAAIASNGMIYFSSDDYNLYAIKPDGNELWESRIGSSQSTLILDSDGTIYVTDSSDLMAINSFGQTIWSTYLRSSYFGSPAISSQGTLYITTYNSLQAIGNNVKPKAPTGINASAASSTETYLTWQSEPKATSYNIYRSKSSNGTYTLVETTTELSYTEDNLSPLTTYWYKVCAVNSYGEGPQSSAISVKTLDENTPTGLNVTSFGLNQANLAWNSVQGATSYKIYRSNSYSSNGEYALIGTTVSETNYSDTGLNNYTTYWYKVSATTPLGESLLTAPVQVYTSNQITLKSVSLEPTSALIGQIIKIKVDAEDDSKSVNAAEVYLLIDNEEAGTVRCRRDSTTQMLVGEYVASRSVLQDKESVTLSVDQVEVQSSRSPYNKLFTAGEDFTSPQTIITDPGINISLSSDRPNVAPGQSPVTLYANVTDDDGQAIPNAVVNFYYYSMDEEDAWYSLPSVRTDEEGLASYPFSAPNITGTFCIIAEVGGVSSTETLELQNESPVPCEIRLTPEKTTIDADGEYQMPLFVEVLDQNGNPMPRQTVSLSVNGPGGLSRSTIQSNPNNGGYLEEEGYYPDLYYQVPTQTGKVEITAQCGDLVSSPLELELVSPSAASFRWNTSEVAISADGSSSESLSGIVYDHNDIPLPGQIVNFSLLGSGELSASRAVSQEAYYGPKGWVQIRITAPRQVGEALLTATVKGVESKPLPVHFIEPIPQSIYWYNLNQPEGTLKLNADGYSTRVIEVVVSDRIGPWQTEGRLQGKEVKFTLTGSGTLSQEIATTDENGIARVTLTAPDVSGEASIVASIGDLQSLPLLVDYINVSGENPEGPIKSIQLNSNSVTVGQWVEFAIELDDEYSFVQGIEAQLKFPQGNRYVWCYYDPSTSTYLGEYLVEASDLQEETTSSVTVDSISIQSIGEYKYFVAGRDFISPSVTVLNPGIQITLSSDKEILTSNWRSEANIEALVKDKNGVALPNVLVKFYSFHENQGGWDYNQAQTDSEGKATIPVRTYNPGKLYVKAEVGGIKNQDELVITCEPPIATTVSLTAEKNTFDADGIFRVPLRVAVYDQSGSPMEGTNVELISQGAGQLNTDITCVWGFEENSPGVSYRVPSRPGTAQIIAKVGDIESQPLNLTFEAQQISKIIWNQELVSISIGDRSHVPIIAYVCNRNGIGIPGQTVSFDLQGAGTLMTNRVASETDQRGWLGGAATGIIAPGQSGEAFLTAKVGELQSEPLPIHYVTAVPLSITWNTSETQFLLNADGKSELSLDVLVLDQNEEEWGSYGRPGEPVKFTLTGSGTLNKEVVGTNVEGVAQVTVTAPEIPGSATLIATIGDLTTTELTINFVEVVPGALQMQIADYDTNEVNIPVLDADGLRQIPVVVKLTDTTGKPMPGEIIDFSNSGHLIFDRVTGITDDGGRVMINMTAPSSPQSAIITASSGDIMINRLIYFDTPKAQNLGVEALVQVAENPRDKGAGLFIGLSPFVDSQGNFTNKKVLGYKVQIDYDPAKVQILDVIDWAHLGLFTPNLNQPGRIIITEAGAVGGNSQERLFFIPLALNGSAEIPTNLIVRFLQITNDALNSIDLPKEVGISLQRGKVISPLDGSGLKIVDAVAAQQYLAGLIPVGSDSKQVNNINLATILPPETGEKKIMPNIKDVITLLQYLAGIRDDYFQLINY